MKSTVRVMELRNRRLSWVIALLILAAQWGACARIKGADPSTLPAEGSNSVENGPDSLPVEDLGYTPVDGAIHLGTQCPIGSFTQPDAVVSALWDCETPQVSRFRILEPSPTVLMQADCRKRLLTVRIKELELDLTWQVLPDGRFSIPVDKNPEITFEADATGDGPCVAKTRLTLSGTLQCSDPDHPEIQVDSVWLLNPPPLPVAVTPSPSPSPSPSLSPTPTPSASPSPVPAPSTSGSPLPSESPAPREFLEFSSVMTQRTCQFQESCLLHAPHRLKQCR